MYLKVRVAPGSPREEVVEEKDGTRYIAVREPAEHNRANERVLALLRLRFPGKRVRLAHGHRSPHKVVSID